LVKEPEVSDGPEGLKNFQEEAWCPFSLLPVPLKSSYFAGLPQLIYLSSFKQNKARTMTTGFYQH